MCGGRGSGAGTTHCVPSLWFGLRPHYGRGNGSNGDLLQKDLLPAHHSSQDCCSPCPWPHGRPLSTHASAGDSWTLTGMFGSVSCGLTAPFSCILVHTRFCLCPPSVCFPSPVEFLQSNPTGLQSRIPGDSQPFCWIPRLGNLLWALKLLQQCENFFGITVLQFVGRLFDGSIVELMATSSKRTYATYHASQVCCRRAPVPTGGHCWPVPPQNTQTLEGRSGSVSCGGHCSFPLVLERTRLSVPSNHLWQVWGLILNVILPLLPSCQGLSFALGCGLFFFFGGILHSPVNGCSAASYDFHVLTREDEHMSFYSAILKFISSEPNGMLGAGSY